MNQLFLDRICAISPGAPDRMLGYSESEIAKVERLYGINVAGDFLSFMLKAGRSDGGIVGDDPYVIYRPSWNARTHILFQMGFFNDLQDIGAWSYLNKPFVFSLESESQYFFLQTGWLGDSSVFHYDGNEKIVRRTGLSICEYMIGVLDRYPCKGLSIKGDLLNI